MIRVPSVVQYLEQGVARWVFALCDQRYVRRRPETPGIVTLSSQQSEVYMAQFRVTAALPVPAKPDDVAKRTLSVTVDGSAPTEYDIDPAALTFEFPTPFAANQLLEGDLIDVDAAGNASPASHYTYTVTDTTPPPQPGQLAFESVQID